MCPDDGLELRCVSNFAEDHSFKPTAVMPADIFSYVGGVFWLVCVCVVDFCFLLQQLLGLHQIEITKHHCLSGRNSNVRAQNTFGAKVLRPANAGNTLHTQHWGRAFLGTFVFVGKCVYNIFIYIYTHVCVCMHTSFDGSSPLTGFGWLFGVTTVDFCE